MTYLNALHFAIEDAYDNLRNVVDEDAERFYQELASTLEKLENDLIRLLDKTLTTHQVHRLLERQSTSRRR